MVFDVTGVQTCALPIFHVGQRHGKGKDRPVTRIAVPRSA
jgi:hypothetical protein